MEPFHGRLHQVVGLILATHVGIISESMTPIFGYPDFLAEPFVELLDISIHRHSELLSRRTPVRSHFDGFYQLIWVLAVVMIRNEVVSTGLASQTYTLGFPLLKNVRASLPDMRTRIHL